MRWQDFRTNLLVNFRAESAAPSEGMGLRNNIRTPHNLLLGVKYLGKHSPPSNIYKGVIEMDSFIGAWRLISFEFRSKDGQVSYPFGEDAVGYIIYSQDGYVSITVMSANRPDFASGDITGGSIEEKISAVDTFFSYCGRYEVRGDRVIHHLEVSLFPNWIGADHERIFEFEDNRLILSTPPLLWGGVEQTGRVTWERV